MSATQSSLPRPSTPIVQQQNGPYVSGYGHLQQPNRPPIRNPPLRWYFPLYYPLLSIGVNLL